MTLSRLATLATIAALSSPAWATTYYVTKTGDDLNPGTAAAPWRTIQNAASSFHPGDTVIIAGGTYSEQVAIERHGPATFKAADGAWVWIDGRAPITGWSLANCAGTNDCYSAANSGPGEALWADGVRCEIISWDETQNGCGAPPRPEKCIDEDSECWVDTASNRAWIRLPGNDDPNSHLIQIAQKEYGIYINRADNITIDGINIIGTYSHGFHLMGPSRGVTYKNATVEATGFSRRGATGFRSRGVNIQGRGTDGTGYVVNSLVQNVTAVDVGRSGFTWIRGVKNSTWDGCVAHSNIYHNGFDNLSAADADTEKNSGNTITNCEAYNNQVGMLIQSCDGCVLHGNRIHHNGTGILLQRTSGSSHRGVDNVVRKNIVYGNSGDGILIKDETNLSIFNNTIQGNGQMGVTVGGDSTVVMINNILSDNALRALKVLDASGFNSHTMHHNLYYRGRASNLIRWEGGSCSPACTYGTLFSFQAGLAQEADSTEANPLYTSLRSYQLSLTSSSPAIDAGGLVGLPFSGNAPDMGALEFAGLPPSAPVLLGVEAVTEY